MVEDMEEALKKGAMLEHLLCSYIFSIPIIVLGLKH